MMFKNRRNAFSMLELIFVIVIMGILGKFGVEFIAQAYESFIFSKINNDLQSKSAAAVEFIAKRLEYRIKNSIISRNLIINDYNYLSDTGLSDPNATVLEWISADTDGFRGTNAPLWSGVIDLNASTATKLISPATDTNALNTQIGILSYVNNATVNDTAIYFIGSYLSAANPWGYEGPINDQNETLHPIQAGTNIDELLPNGSDFSGKEVFEYYKLAWTAYAIELGDYNDTSHIGNLYFYYDYRPWKGETYVNNGKKVLLAEGINTFRFRSAGSLIKVQVCAKSELTGEEYALCKEKTIY
ncbi:MULTISPECIES: type II secretion system protein [Sulfurimonas]|uniref:type II secretion system protein n=1 Tax=Sulfurimonas TaxID=202746 RepID=UPI001FE341F1|nr:type II secretion system protein [Sulfurimonas indica]